MTIDEAIEQLEMDQGDILWRKGTRSYDALKLGIEALKHLRECWEARECGRIYLLPGETEN